MKTLYETQRINMHESIRLTTESLNHYGPLYEHWAICWSGGKDSTTLLTLLLYLLTSGQVQWPKSLTILYADTRMELPPLAIAAQWIIDDLRDRGLKVRVVTAPMDKRYFVYMFGRGVPTPGAHFRWCTGMLKIAPMQEAVQRVYAQTGTKLLVLTGVRQGESAMRDGRIAMSCGRDGAECGQGWFQETLPGEACNTLAPLLHWRVCHVWEWLKHWAPKAEFGDWDTSPIADAYGGDEAEEINARTGCICCPVASKDKALTTILKNNAWAYLAPLLELRDLYEDMRLAKYRLRKPAGETGAGGKLVRNQERKGPLTFEARRIGLASVLDIQARVNDEAWRLKRPRIDIINSDEVARCLQLIEARTWPSGWHGDEPVGEKPITDDFGLWCNEACYEH